MINAEVQNKRTKNTGIVRHIYPDNSARVLWKDGKLTTISLKRLVFLTKPTHQVIVKYLPATKIEDKYQVLKAFETEKEATSYINESIEHGKIYPSLHRDLYLACALPY